ncbi:MFS transporter [Rhodovastum atsumiense]|nr:MFS transporter [Rhodovastum atsumiense]CAH2600141.1 MFS transporter [Rhodovastum atsumiense]
MQRANTINGLVFPGDGQERLNFLTAALLTGFGPFIVVYLTRQGWSPAEIGWAVTTATVAAMAGQVPAGVLVDRLPCKRWAAGGALIAIGVAAALLASWPGLVPGLFASVVQGFGGCLLGLALAGIAVGSVDRGALTLRLARNLRFSAAGNACGAVVMGGCGMLLSPASVLWLAALLCLPCLLVLRAMPASGPASGHTPASSRDPRPKLWPSDCPGMLPFAAVVVLFQFGNAALLLLKAADLGAAEGARASLVVAGCIVLPQLTMIMVSPLLARATELWGRRHVMALALAMLPLRALLFAVVSDPMVLVLVQALDGISGAAFGLLVPLTVADLTRGKGGFNVVAAAIGLAGGMGAALSAGCGGSLAAVVGTTPAFLAFAVIGLAAVGLYAMVVGPAPVIRPNRVPGNAAIASGGRKAPGATGRSGGRPGLAERVRSGGGWRHAMAPKQKAPGPLLPMPPAAPPSPSASLLPVRSQAA